MFLPILFWDLLILQLSSSLFIFIFMYIYGCTCDRFTGGMPGMLQARPVSSYCRWSNAFCNFLSACILQTGVCWPTTVAFHSFATVLSIHIGNGCQFRSLEIFPNGGSGQSGAPNLSLPYLPIRGDFHSSALELVRTNVGVQSGATNFSLPSTPIRDD